MDCDAYGHVDNSVHNHWFDTAVNAVIVKAGGLDIAAGRSICVVVDTGRRYARAVSFPAIVETRLRIAHQARASVRSEIGQVVDGGDAVAGGASPMSMSTGRRDAPRRSATTGASCCSRSPPVRFIAGTRRGAHTGRIERGE